MSCPTDYRTVISYKGDLRVSGLVIFLDLGFTWCFLSRMLTLVRSFPNSSLCSWEEMFWSQESSAEQLCVKSSARLASNRHWALAWVVLSNSSHCFCRLLRVSDTVCSSSGFSFTNTWPSCENKKETRNHCSYSDLCLYVLHSLFFLYLVWPWWSHLMNEVPYFQTFHIKEQFLTNNIV